MPGYLHSVVAGSDREQAEQCLRVIVADDHAGLRQNLRRLLEQEGMEVVADAGDFATTIRHVAAEQPDVLVLDLHMHDGTGAERIARLKAASAGTTVVVVTMQDSAMFAQQALKSGALGFVLADTADQELDHAVRRAAAGQVYQSPRVKYP